MASAFKHGNPGCNASSPCTCGCTWHVAVTVTNCDGTPDSGASVSLTGPGGFSASGGTNSSGVYSVAVPGTGTYTATVGSQSGSVTLSGTTCTTGTVAICAPTFGVPFGQVCVTVVGCNNTPIVGVSVTATQSGVTVNSGTTNSSGVACFCVPSGHTTTFAVTAPPSRYGTGSTTGTVTACPSSPANFTIALPAASGYVCFCCLSRGCATCSVPVSTTLHLTDSYFGSGCTLTYNATTGQWVGSQTVSVAGCTSPAGPAFSCPSGTTTITYTLGAMDNGFGTSVCALNVGYTLATGAGNCPGTGGGTGTPAYGPVPYSLNSCPPSFNVTFSDSHPHSPPFSGNLLYTYSDCYTEGTTITVTE